MKVRDRGDLSPESLEAVEARLSLIEGLKRKYGTDIRDIAFYLDGLRKERDDLVGIRETLARIDGDIARARSAFESKAGALSRARTKAARALEKTIEAEITQLGMQKARFEIRVASASSVSEDAERVRDTGLDDVEFLIAPNPGEPPKPLRRIASGGELSRIMLALKAAGTGKASRPRPSSSTRSTPGSAGRRPSSSPASSRPWPASIRSSASPICPRSRRSPRIITGSKRRSPATGRTPPSAGSPSTSESRRSPGSWPEAA